MSDLQAHGSESGHRVRQKAAFKAIDGLGFRV